jgi:hypothetical protein
MRIFTLSLLLLCPIAASARVISYAPYTDKVATRAYQARNTRHFALIETPAAGYYPNYSYNAQVVLYDTKGIDPPRVIYPKSGTATIYNLALFQEGDRVPVVLVLAENETVVTRDGGRSWWPVTGLSKRQPFRATDVDYGGPWTQGLAAPVRTATRAWPFVVAFENGVYAISPGGTARLMISGPFWDNPLIGQNRGGTEFLIRTDYYRDKLVAIGLDGKWRSIGAMNRFDFDAGWIAGDGSAYVIDHSWSSDLEPDDYSRYRTLYLYRNGRRELVAEQSEWGASLAIPTHDFNGAWFLEWAEEWKTTLYHHKPGGKLETMWVDEAAPEVEALHAGAAGDKVLIQVHRPRIAPEKVFIDPALAVWHVGKPAPAEYDELFLSEGPEKGFVHLDVDRMEAGEPFVFDSSFIRPEPPALVVSPPSGGSDVVQEWGVVRASLKQRLVIPSASRMPGLMGSQWLTDLVILNPLDEPQEVVVEYVGSNDAMVATANEPVTITLDPNEIRVVTDVLGTLFGVEQGSGSLQFVPAVGVNLTARTYSRTGVGTYGYAMPAIDFFNSASPRFPVSFAGAFQGPGTETRVVVTDTSGAGMTATLQPTNGSGKVASAGVAAETPANGVLQLEIASAERGGLIVQPARGHAIAAVISTDTRTNDATYFPPDLPASSMRTIPFAVSTGTLRTDLYLLNLSPHQRSVNIEVKPYDTNQWPRLRSYSLKPYESRLIEDPVKLFGFTGGMARLRYASWGAEGDSTGVRVTSRTYAVAENGGTYGTLVPPMNSFQSVTGGEYLEILTHTGGMRVSLGLVELSANPRSQPSEMEIAIVDDRGATIDKHTVKLNASGGLYLDDLFAARNLTPPPAVRIVIRALNEWSLTGAYALLTDPVTSDTTYIGASLGAKVK